MSSEMGFMWRKSKSLTDSITAYFLAKKIESTGIKRWLISKSLDKLEFVSDYLEQVRDEQDKAIKLAFRQEQALMTATITGVFIPILLIAILPMDTRAYILGFNYSLSFSHFFDNIALSLIVAFSMVTGTLGYLFGGHPGQSIIHVNGLNFRKSYTQTSKDFQALEGAQLEAEKNRGAIEGLKLGDFVQISRQREVGHINVNGVPGGGKTVLFKYLLKQIGEHGDRLLIHDPKGDYCAFIPLPLYKGGGSIDTNDFSKANAVIFAPWDDRSVWWDISADITDPNLAMTFAATLFPASKGDNSFWSDAAREIMAASISYLIRTKGSWKKQVPDGKGGFYLTEGNPNAVGWGWKDVADLFAHGADHLLDCARKGDPNIEMLIAKAKEGGNSDEKLKQNMMSTVASKVGWIAPYANSFDFDPKDRFSIVEWLAKTERYANINTVILQNNLSYRTRAEQIFVGMMSCFSAYANSSLMPEISADQQGYYLLLDEYPQLGKGVSDVVRTTMELGRSRGIRVIFAYQDESQLDSLFGREDGRVQRALQQTKIYCKSDKETASTVAQQLGQREIVRVTDVKGSGAKIEQRRDHTSAPVLTGSDLTGLKIVGGKAGDDSSATGAEIIVLCDNVIGKTIVSFTAMPNLRQAVVESHKWKSGMFSFITDKEGIGSVTDEMKKSTDTDFEEDQALIERERILNEKLAQRKAQKEHERRFQEQQQNQSSYDGVDDKDSFDNADVGENSKAFYPSDRERE